MCAAGLLEMDVLEEASRRLDEATSLEEIKKIRDTAEAVRAYARAAQLGLDLQNSATVLKLSAERKAGGLLASLKLRGGDRRSKKRRTQLTLSDLGISRGQSKRWQQMALIAEQEFSDYLVVIDKHSREVTAAGLLRIARRDQRKRGCVRRSSNSDTERANARKAASEPVVLELANHLRLLNEVLRPVYEGGDLRFAYAELRLAGRLTAEIGLLIQQLPVPCSQGSAPLSHVHE